MEAIFQLPLALLAGLQLLIALLLSGPTAIALPVSRALTKLYKSPANAAIAGTVAVVLAGLLASSLVNLVQNHKRGTRADTRELVAVVDYLRSTIAAVLCVLNLVLLFLGRGLAAALAAADHAKLNLEAMRRQVKGLQTEYARATSGPTPQAAALTPDAKQPSDVAAATAAGAQVQRQLETAQQETARLQAALDAATKARATAEASVVAMKSQLKGFDASFDQLLDENRQLKRRLVGYGDATYAADVAQASSRGKKDE